MLSAVGQSPLDEDRNCVWLRGRSGMSQRGHLGGLSMSEPLLFTRGGGGQRSIMVRVVYP